MMRQFFVIATAALLSALPFAPAAGQLADPPATMRATAPPTGQSTAPPETALVRYAGQVLDYQQGFVFFTTGDGYRVAPDLKIVAYGTGASTSLLPATGLYARATFDPATGRVTELALSRKKIASEAVYEKVKRFAVAQSTSAPNPDLVKSAEIGGFTGKPVLVTFTVQVPPGTPLNANVYLTTDTAGWNAMAFQMDRIDGLHYRLTRDINSGTKLRYLYTRGSWQSVERGKDGLEVAPRQYTVRNLDLSRRDDIVYHWSDENPAQQNVGPNSLPTPFNPDPLGLQRRSPSPSPSPSPKRP